MYMRTYISKPTMLRTRDGNSSNHNHNHDIIIITMSDNNLSGAVPARQGASYIGKPIMLSAPPGRGPARPAGYYRYQ